MPKAMRTNVRIRVAENFCKIEFEKHNGKQNSYRGGYQVILIRVGRFPFEISSKNDNQNNKSPYYIMYIMQRNNKREQQIKTTKQDDHGKALIPIFLVRVFAANDQQNTMREIH